MNRARENLRVSLLMFAALILVFASLSHGQFLAAQAQASNSTVDSDIEDADPPMIKILDPASCSNHIATPGTIVVRGVASDQDSGIEKVEAFSHTYPFNDEFRFKMATPISPGNWSSWSIPIEVYDTKTRILVRATDNAGNENWDEIVIDIPAAEAKLKAMSSGNSVAFVEPSFTEAAYNLDSFYVFYKKYATVPANESITADLDLMTGDIPGDANNTYFMPLFNEVKNFAPQYDVTIIGDTDVNDGLVFNDDGSNRFDVLFMLHNEYATQKEYDNLKQFVSNGGTMVFLDGNVFYGEVSYDRQYCTATLVKGHDWEFDGKSVHKSVSERYFSENQQWVGSNYMINDISDPVSFANNPFNYTHFEENYVANPNDVILHDYGLTIGANYQSDPSHVNDTIATYELHSGKGKVIMLGVYGQNLTDNPKFLEFFGNVVLPHAFFSSYKLKVNDDITIPIYYFSESADIDQITINDASKSLNISMENAGSEGQNDSSVLWIVLPKNLIDAASGTHGATPIPAKLAVSVDGATEQYDLYETSAERILKIPISPDASTVQVQGTKIIPEFPLYGTIGLSAILLSIVLIIYRSSGFHRMNL